MMRGMMSTLKLTVNESKTRVCRLPAETFDFQRPYMEMWLNFIGVTDIESIVVEKTLLGPELDREVRSRARQEAADVARRVGR